MSSGIIIRCEYRGEGLILCKIKSRKKFGIIIA